MDDSILTPYRLRTVRTGVQATWLALVALAAYPLLPGSAIGNLPLYAGVIVVAAAGALLVMLLPWRRLFERGWGTRCMYAWSVLDIGLITVAITSSGGDRSPLFVLYALTTLFFALSYPYRAQMALAVFTVCTYGGALVVMDPAVNVAWIGVRIALLLVVGFLSSFLGRELASEMASHRRARDLARRHADALSAVAAAARRISSLEPDRVLAAVVDSAVALGFETSAICQLEDDGVRYRFVQPRGLPDRLLTERPSAGSGMTGRVFTERRTVISEDYQSLDEALPALKETGIRVAVVTPVWSEGRIVAALAAGRRSSRRIEPHDIEALDLLAAQAGHALENAHRFERQERAVHRLQELDRMKRDFVDMASHELRTPLSVIGGIGLTLARRWERLDEATRSELLGRLNASARSLNEIVSSLLDLSRIEDPDHRVDPQPVPLSLLVGESLDRLESVLRRHDVRSEIQPGLVAWGDPTLLERVLDNLLVNAAKHTLPGTVVTIAAREGRGDVEVSVEDNGPGIAPSDLEHLGERFYRGGDPNDRPTRGAGLGLALAREILALHGARLDVSSRLGEGARFSFSLPLHRARAVG